MPVKAGRNSSGHVASGPEQREVLQPQSELSLAGSWGGRVGRQQEGDPSLGGPQRWVSRTGPSFMKTPVSWG